MAENESLKKDWENVWKLEKIEEVSEKDPAFKIVRKIFSKYKKGSNMLDAGSGLGRWVFYFQKNGYQGHGIDIASEAIEKSKNYAKYKNLNCKFFIGDVRKLPFNEEFLEVLVSFGTIEHFPESLDALKEFHRTLKKGGTCLVTVPNVYSIRTLVTRPILKIFKSYKFGYQGFEKSFTPEQLSKLMREAGFHSLEFGILPDGVFLGDFYRFIPVAGKFLTFFSRKISFWIESHQSKLGHTSFCVGIK